MPRYIDADALLKCKGQAYDENGVGLYVVGTGDILRMPTADVVEVVRCKDCVSCVPRYMDFTGDPYWICHNWVAQVDADGFCYEGERREDGEIH